MLNSEEELKSIFKSQIDEIKQEKNCLSHESFTRWVAEYVLDLNDSDTDDAIEIGGSGDNAVDLFFVDETEELIIIGQTKYSDNFNYNVQRQELLDFLHALGRLEEYPPRNGNQIFKEKCEDYKAAINRGYQIKMVYAVTGNFSESAKDELNSPLLQFHKPLDVDLQILNMNKIYQYVKSLPTPPITIQFEKGVSEMIEPVTNFMSLTGTVKASEIIRIFSDNEERLFLENPRQSLGLTTTNKAIIDTLESIEGRRKFWKYNNGISAICEKILKLDSGERKYQFNNFKIVNGRQTTFSLYKAKKHVDDTVRVLLRVHEASEEQERDEISKNTNTQNVIKPSDLFSNKSEIRTLGLKIERDYPNWYFEVQKGAFKMLKRDKKNSITKRRVLEKVKIARCFMAFSKKPWDALKMGETDLFIKHFDEIFLGRSPNDLMVTHILYLSAEALANKWKTDVKKELPYHIMKLNVIKYYLLAIISDSLSNFKKSEKDKIVGKIIEIFSQLKRTDDVPESLLQIVENSFDRLDLGIMTLAGKTISDPKELKDYLVDDKDRIVHILNVLKKTDKNYGGNYTLKSNLSGLV